MLLLLLVFVSIIIIIILLFYHLFRSLCLLPNYLVQNSSDISKWDPNLFCYLMYVGLYLHCKGIVQFFFFLGLLSLASSFTIISKLYFRYLKHFYHLLPILLPLLLLCYLSYPLFPTVTTPLQSICIQSICNYTATYALYNTMKFFWDYLST